MNSDGTSTSTVHFTNTHTHTHTHTHTYIHINIHIHTHNVYMHVHIHKHEYSNTYTFPFILWLYIILSIITLFISLWSYLIFFGRIKMNPTSPIFYDYCWDSELIVELKIRTGIMVNSTYRKEKECSYAYYLRIVSRFLLF